MSIGVSIGVFIVLSPSVLPGQFDKTLTLRIRPTGWRDKLLPDVSVSADRVACGRLDSAARFRDEQALVAPAHASARMCGNRITSRMLGLSVRIITNRSMPMPAPAVGGMPTSSARMKSAS